MFERVRHRASGAANLFAELGFDEFTADTRRSQYRIAAVLLMHADGQPDGIGKIAVDALEDPLEELGRSGVSARLEGRHRHDDPPQSLVITVATLSSPDIPRSVLICPSGLTTIVSLVVAARENSARTAELSQ